MDAVAGDDSVQNTGKDGEGNGVLQLSKDIAEREGAKVGGGGGAWGGIKVSISLQFRVSDLIHPSLRYIAQSLRRLSSDARQACPSKRQRHSKSAWRLRQSFEEATWMHAMIGLSSNCDRLLILALLLRDIRLRLPLLGVSVVLWLRVTRYSVVNMGFSGHLVCIQFQAT